MRMLKTIPALFFVFLSMSSLGYCMEGEDSLLYSGMNYKTIFDQRAVLAKHPEALDQEGLPRVAPPKVVKEGCFTWVFHKLTCGCFRNDDSFDEYSVVENPSLIGDFEDQDSDLIILLDSKTSKKLNSDTAKNLNNALLQDFKTKKGDAMKRTLRKPIFSMFVDGAIYGTGMQLLPSDGYGSGVSAFVCLNILAENVKLFSKAAYSVYIAPLGDPLEPHEQRYAKYKRFLSPALQETIEDKFGAARKSSQSIQEVQSFCRIALNLPLTSKKLRMPDLEELKDLLGGYVPDITKPIQRNLFNHFKRFSYKVNPPKTPKSVIYLQGPPGVGKTYIAKKLAKLMNADFIKLAVSKHGKNFLGTEQEAGSFLEKIARPNRSRNAVIFIDEFDRLINREEADLTVFLPFLEPTSTDFDSPYLKSDVDISHFFFILAGNGMIQDEAMESRAELISIERVTDTFKKKIIKKRRSPDELALVDLDALVAKDTNPGVRALELKVNNEIRDAQLEEAAPTQLHKRKIYCPGDGPWGQK